MKCVIIAAGKGSRLANKVDSKPLLPLHGIPLIHRVILNVMEAGFRDFYIVTGYNGDKIRENLSRFAKEQPVSLQFIHNEEWEKPNGISVLCAGEKVHEPFFLLMSDHIFEPAVVKEMAADGLADGEVKLAVDLRIDNNPLVDIDDVTKVLTEDGRILDIGKTIPKYNAFDTGIFLCSPALFDALGKSIAAGDASLSGGIRAMAATKKARIFDIGSRNWIDVDDEAAFNKAREIFPF